MKTYQIPLNPQSMASLDELEHILRIPKVEIIQKAIAQLKKNIEVFSLKKAQSPQPTYKHFNNLIGFIDLKTKQKTTYARHVDEIYNTN